MNVDWSQNGPWACEWSLGERPTFPQELALALVHDLVGEKAEVDHVALTHEGEAAVLQYDIFLFWPHGALQEFT